MKFKTRGEHILDLVYSNTVNIEKYTDYIAKCTEDITELMTYTVQNNQKPWMTAKVHQLLGAWDTTFRGGDMAAYRSAGSVVCKGIRAAKRSCKEKIQDKHGKHQANVSRDKTTHSTQDKAGN